MGTGNLQHIFKFQIFLQCFGHVKISSWGTLFQDTDYRHENNCYKMRAVSAGELIYICNQSSTKVVSRQWLIQAVKKFTLSSLVQCNKTQSLALIVLWEEQALFCFISMDSFSKRKHILFHFHLMVAVLFYGTKWWIFFSENWEKPENLTIWGFFHHFFQKKFLVKTRPMHSLPRQL